MALQPIQQVRQTELSHPQFHSKKVISNRVPKPEYLSVNISIAEKFSKFFDMI